ncbi:MAG: TIGR03564 family F420-dependent LLM class oxidoreductase [Acidimicrobiales bacterium]
MMAYGAGLNTSKALPEVVDEARRLAAAGFSCLSSSHIFGYDALTLLTAVGLGVPEVELMTAVVPIYTRHPVAMAQQALTVQAVTGGRLVLGVGLSHQVVIEQVYSMSFDQPLRAMREYLAILLPLLGHERSQFRGETVGASAGPLEIDTPAPQVIVAALGTSMLELAGEVADGTVTWMTGPRTLGEHIVPTIKRAAERAGRPAPRIMAALPVCVTDDVGRARQTADESFAIYGTLPSYRAMLDREGAAGPGDVAIVGDEAEVRSVLASVEAAGVTDFSGAPIGTREEVRATLALLGDLARSAP